MNRDKTSPLATFKIPHLPLVVREAFAVYLPEADQEDPGTWTIEDLATRANLPIDAVIKRLNQIESTAAQVEINSQDLKALIDSQPKDLYLLDVRQPWEYEICHIDGSKLISTIDLAQIMPILKESDVITICHHGIRSLSAAHYLKEAGVPRVRSLIGGVEAWAQIVDSAMPRY